MRQVLQEDFAVILLDVQMPRLDGYGVCKAIKSDPATAHLPVLICSSLGESAAANAVRNCSLRRIVRAATPRSLSSR